MQPQFLGLHAPGQVCLQRAGGAGRGAVRVVFHAVGGYSDSLPVAKALEPTTVVAYGMNDRSLPRAHGFPARIIVPGIYGMKNVKWLQRIEVVDYDYRGYWQRSDGWDNIAEIKTASRIDVPEELTALQGAGALVAGLAWAGDRLQAVAASFQEAVCDVLTRKAIDACASQGACDKGLLCLDSVHASECKQDIQGCCLPICDTAAPMCPGVGQTCTPLYEGGGGPAGLENVGVCALPP